MNKNQIENLAYLNRQFEKKLKENQRSRKLAKENINFYEIITNIKARKFERGN